MYGLSEISAMQSQLVCSGCRSILVYPRGATNVCCALCNSVTSVPPPGTTFLLLFFPHFFSHFLCSSRMFNQPKIFLLVFIYILFVCKMLPVDEKEQEKAI